MYLASLHAVMKNRDTHSTYLQHKLHAVSQTAAGEFRSDTAKTALEQATNFIARKETNPGHDLRPTSPTTSVFCGDLRLIL